MTYATYEDYQNEFGDDLQSDAQARVARSIERASKLADVYIRSRGLTVPLTAPSAIGDIRGSVLDIARLYAWPDNTTEEIRKRYEDAISFFESIATGKVKLITNTEAVTVSGFANIRLFRA
jgi:phage gp36-like protein